MSPHSSLSAAPTRRSIAKGAAWTAPAVVLGAAVPAYASSLVKACPTCVTFGATSDSDNFTMTSAGTVSRVMNPILNLNLTWGTCDASTYPNGVTFAFTSATVTLNDPIAGNTFNITYAISGGSQTLSSTATSATFSWSSAILGNNPGVPVHRSTFGNNQFTPVKICWTGTYSYVVGSTTFTGNITLCNSFCSFSSQYTCNASGGVSYQWSGTTCAAAPLSSTCS